MEKRYWEKTYNFTARSDVPFQYVCGHCGKTVSGVREVKTTYKYLKTAAFDKWASDEGRNSPKLSLLEEEEEFGNKKAQELLKKELAFQKTEVEKGNYKFLREHTKCPYCQTEQIWAYPLKKCWLEILFGVVATPLGAFLLYLFIAGIRGTGFSLDYYGEDAIPILTIGGAMFLTLGICSAVIGVLELRKRNAMKEQKQQLPIVRFPSDAAIQDSELARR